MRLVAERNASFWIIVSESGKEMLARVVQPWKAFCGISVTSCEMVMWLLAPAGQSNEDWARVDNAVMSTTTWAKARICIGIRRQPLASPPERPWACSRNVPGDERVVFVADNAARLYDL